MSKKWRTLLSFSKESDRTWLLASGIVAAEAKGKNIRRRIGILYGLVAILASFCLIASIVAFVVGIIWAGSIGLVGSMLALYVGLRLLKACYLSESVTLAGFSEKDTTPKNVACQTNTEPNTSNKYTKDIIWSERHSPSNTRK